MKTQLIGLNDYTDGKEWELVIRKIDDRVWGFYRYADSQSVVSDSQFDIFQRTGCRCLEDEDLQEELKMRFSLYCLYEEQSQQF